MHKYKNDACRKSKHLLQKSSDKVTIHPTKGSLYLLLARELLKTIKRKINVINIGNGYFWDSSAKALLKRIIE